MAIGERPTMAELGALSRIVRGERSRLRARIQSHPDSASGLAALAAELADGVPSCVAKMPLGDMVVWVKRMQRMRAERLCRLAGASPAREVGKLTARQLEVLCALMRGEKPPVRNAVVYAGHTFCPVEPLRVAFRASPMTLGDVARKLDWWDHHDSPDSQRVARTLGLKPYPSTRGRMVTQKRCSRETFERFADALGLAWWEVDRP